MTRRTATEPDHTADGRYIVVDGRRWRASDPSIPATLRQELVDELMDARRTVGVAKRASDEAGETAARQRVQHAKVALGERGEPWWDPPSEDGLRDRLAAAMMALSRHREPSTICPSDAARAVGGTTWRSQMDTAREVARALATSGFVAILQHGEPVDPGADWKGPIRVRHQQPSATVTASSAGPTDAKSSHRACVE